MNSFIANSKWEGIAILRKLFKKQINETIGNINGMTKVETAIWIEVLEQTTLKLNQHIEVLSEHETSGNL